MTDELAILELKNHISCINLDYDTISAIDHAITAIEERAKLKELLKELEWIEKDIDFTRCVCPVCHQYKPYHKEYCKLSKALEE
jgi:hypothetical protein